MAKTKDEKLLESEDPQQQVDRMGNHWVLPGQYEKQLRLPVHLVDGEPPQLRKVSSGQMLATYATVCGLIVGDVTMRTTDDPDDVTCQACAKG